MSLCAWGNRGTGCFALHSLSPEPFCGALVGDVLAMGLAPPPCHCGTVLVGVDPTLAHPWGSSLPPPDPYPHGSVPACPRDGFGKHPSTPTPQVMDRTVDKDVTQEGRAGESLVPVGVLEEIQVLLMPLLETLQQQFVLRPLQLQHPDLPGIRGEGPCAAPGTELP